MHTRTYILHIHMHIHIHIRLDIDMDMDIDIAIYTHAHHKYIIYTWGRAGGGSWDEDGEEECSWNLLCWSAMKPISPSEGNSWGYIHIDYSKKMSNRWNRYIYIVQHIQYIYIYIVLVYILYTNSITLEIQLRPPNSPLRGFPPTPRLGTPSSTIKSRTTQRASALSEPYHRHSPKDPKWP